ncbi:MAG: hypothetical protein KDC95_05485 [Planctomycetes bacterium]|nr:hypothetical protein [Planctomycetota bacterium]
MTLSVPPLAAQEGEQPWTYEGLSTTEWNRELRSASDIESWTEESGQHVERSLRALFALAEVEPEAKVIAYEALTSSRFLSMSMAILGRTVDKRAIEVLQSQVQRHPEATEFLIALGGLGRRAVPSVLRLARQRSLARTTGHEETRDVLSRIASGREDIDVYDVIGNIGEAATPFVLKLLEREGDVRHEVAWRSIRSLRADAAAGIPALVLSAQQGLDPELFRTLSHCGPTATRVYVAMLEEEAPLPDAIECTDGFRYDPNDRELCARLVSVVNAGKLPHAIHAARLLARPLTTDMQSDARSNLAASLRAIARSPGKHGAALRSAVVDTLSMLAPIQNCDVFGELIRDTDCARAAVRALMRAGPSGIPALIASWKVLPHAMKSEVSAFFARYPLAAHDAGPVLLKELDQRGYDLSLTRDLAAIRPDLLQRRLPSLVRELCRNGDVDGRARHIVAKYAMHASPLLSDLLAPDRRPVESYLGKLGPRILPDLRELLTNADSRRFAILVAHTMGEDARPLGRAIAAFIDDRDYSAVALRALAEIDPDRLRRLIETQRDSRLAIARLVLNQSGRSMDRSRDALALRFPGLKQSSLFEFDLELCERMQRGKGAVPELVRLLDLQDPKLRWRVVAALGYLGSQAEAAVPNLVPLLADRASDLCHAAGFDNVHVHMLDADRRHSRASLRKSQAEQGPFWEVRCQAAWALLQAGDAGRQALEHALETGNMLDDLLPVLECLGEECRPLTPCVLRMLRASRNSGDGGAQRQSSLLHILAAVGDRVTDAREAMLEVVSDRSVRNWSVRRLAFECIESTAIPAARLANVVDVLVDEHDRAALAVARSLIAAATCESADDLAACRSWLRLADPRLRAACAHALSRTRNADGYEVFHVGLFDGDVDVRIAFLAALAHSSNHLVDCREDLAQLIRVGSTAERRAALRAMARAASCVVTEAVLPRLEDEDPVTRWHAILAIVCAGDEAIGSAEAWLANRVSLERARDARSKERTRCTRVLLQRLRS